MLCFIVVRGQCAVPAQRDADAATQQQCACARFVRSLFAGRSGACMGFLGVRDRDSMRPGACSMRLFSLLTLLRLVLCKHLRSIKWQYNVPIELLLLRPPRPDLAGNTPQVADLSSMQVWYRALLLCALMANDSRPTACLSASASGSFDPAVPISHPSHTINADPSFRLQAAPHCDAQCWARRCFPRQQMDCC